MGALKRAPSVGAGCVVRSCVVNALTLFLSLELQGGGKKRNKLTDRGRIGGGCVAAVWCPVVGEIDHHRGFLKAWAVLCGKL